MIAWGRFMVLAHCTMYYCNEHECQVSSQFCNRRQSYALDKQLDAACQGAHLPTRTDRIGCPYTMGDPIIHPIFDDCIKRA